jgi:hypothetical protein
MPPLAECDCLGIAPAACETSANPQPAPTVDAGLPLAVAGRYGWAARDYDAATSLQYNVTRYYCPAVRQWTAEDLAGFSAHDIRRDYSPGYRRDESSAP